MSLTERLPLSSVTPTIRIAGMERDGHDLVELFAENTKLRQSNIRAHRYRIIPHLRNEATVRAGAHGYKVYLDAPSRPLPPAAGEAGLRESARRFPAYSAQHLGAVERTLATALRRDRRRQAAALEDVVYALGRYPSAGGLFPVEHYALLPGQTGTAFDAWYVDPHRGALAQVATGLSPQRLFGVLATDQDRLGTPAAVVLQTVIHQRSTAKYGARGYRFALTEAGCAAQCLLDAATAEGLASLCWGGYIDDEINAILGVNGVDETVIGCILLGATDEKTPV
ncbi:SagB/ThcOx family dehydrogenase [uncultured Roseobacter sp.]|uniref:SagB/ThcOx family dehydrogenase n=1 Tax=uncultured Roseobacter sp. TaxID=114847 RepID=UPI00262FCC16|nr:SagB/ThcOx family dehydrogenase [uncultured Roseobacter sp.]